MKKPKIGIIGASIAGCAAAILLNRLGFNVQVFEKRAPETISDLGAGIVLPNDLIDELKNVDLLDKDFPFMPLLKREFLALKTDNHYERTIGFLPMSGSAIHWGILYNQLAKRLSKGIVQYNDKITDIIEKDNSISLLTNKGMSKEFDFILCADGYRSLGRKYLYPDAKPKFTDYTCWQGVYNSNNTNVTNRLDGKVLYYVYEKGVLLIYEIPILSQNKSSENITWFFYEMTDQKHSFVRDNKVHVNIYQENMTDEYIFYLHNLANTYLPPFANKIITNTKQPFTHAIYDTMVPNYYSKKVALIGDAGILLRPHLGSGATKALQDALSLYHHVNKESDSETALKLYAKERHKAAAHLFELSRLFGDFLVAKPPNWNEITAEQLNTMWNDIVAGYNWYQHNGTDA